MADRLPEEAKAKFVALRDKRDELSTLSRAASDEWQGIHLQKQAALQRVAVLTDPLQASRAGDGRTYHPDHPSVIAAKAQAEKQSLKLRHLEERRDALSFRRAEIATLIDNIERYLTRLPRPATLYTGPTPTLRNGETASDAIARVREERAERAADLHSVRSAPIPTVQAKAKVRDEVEALARRGGPDVLHVIDYGGDIRWPARNFKSALFGSAVIDGSVGPLNGVALDTGPDALAILAWLHKAELLDALDAEIDALADDSAALTDEERTSRETALRTAILELERAEEGFVEMAAGEVSRRPDADPRAVLGLSSDLPDVPDAI